MLYALLRKIKGLPACKNACLQSRNVISYLNKINKRTPINFTPLLRLAFLVQTLKAPCTEAVQASQQPWLHQLLPAQPTLPFLHRRTPTLIRRCPRGHIQVLTHWALGPRQSQRAIPSTERRLLTRLPLIFLSREASENVKNTVHFHF